MVSRLLRGSVLGIGFLLFASAAAVVMGQEEASRTIAVPTREVIETKIMDQRITLQVFDSPLKEVAEQLSELLEVPIRIDSRALDDVGLTTDAPVTLQAIDVRAQGVLRRMLKELDLTYRIDQHGVEFTTPEEAENDMGPPRYYSLGDLVYDEEDQVHADAMIELITTTIVPESWEELGGPGSLAFYGGGLVITQTEEIHRLVSRLFRGLRVARKRDRENPLDPITLESHLGDFHTVVQRIRETTVDLPNEQYPLEKLGEELSKVTGLTIWIDTRALDDVGLATDTATQGPWQQVSVERVLDDLKQLDLDWMAIEGIVIITTPEEAESELLVRVYPVADLIAAEVQASQTGFNPWHTDSAKAKKATGDPTGVLSGSYAGYDPLIEMLTTTVVPESWEELGGPGTLSPYPLANCLVVAQTRQIHQEIDQLLGQIRANQPPRSEKEENEGAGQEAVEEQEEAPKQTEKTDPPMVVRNYFITQPGSGKDGEREDLEKVRTRIMKTIDPQAWENEEAYIDLYQGRIVIHQRADIQHRIRSFLEATGFYGPHYPGSLPQPHSPQGGMGGASGGGGGGGGIFSVLSAKVR
ncbi:MAG: hypothetical protein WD045_07815 [Pirellulaceae bacterium]